MILVRTLALLPAALAVVALADAHHAFAGACAG